MINQRIVCSTILSVLLAGGLSACNKKKDEAAAPVETAASATAAPENGVKSENDLYIERLNKDVKVENPDALLDEVNKDTQHK